MVELWLHSWQVDQPTSVQMATGALVCLEEAEDVSHHVARSQHQEGQGVQWTVREQEVVAAVHEVHLHATP